MFVHILTEIMHLTVNAVLVRFVKHLYTGRHSLHITLFLPCKEGLTTLMTKITIHNKHTFKELKHKRETQRSLAILYTGNASGHTYDR